ncbi:alpha/beta hydrolase [Alicyclobacillus acidoterrestris]|uniref:alpha/beta fold hydrolase n=1 Tax=Alicyclobacillus suci TaxID=2816080 RepID=UPI0011977BF3|nr:alpha/beta hydrolase [Alicyclobacillus suci]GEO26451.1 alpha/beta hydrolase [Alicyclobacillus acidoterrestris]
MPEKKMESRLLNTGDVELHLLTSGSPNGVPLVFLPGITSLAKSFNGIVERLPDSYYCVSVDMRGRGRSTHVKDHYRMSDYVSDVLAVVNLLIDNPISPILVGHSMGARVAAAFATRYPKLVSGIVLVDPPIHGPGQRDEYPTPLDTFLYQKRLADSGRREAFQAQFPGLSEMLVQLREEEYQNVCVEAIVQSYDAFFTEPFHVYVKALDCPTLLLAAELGGTILDEEFQLLSRLNPAMEAIRVPGVGHMIYKDDPERFTDYVTQFVDKLAP